MSDRPFDSFAYRHRVADVMVSPVQTIGRDATLRQTAARLHERDISALIVSDGGGGLCGIVTERDLVRAASGGADFEATAVEAVMTAEVATIGPDAFAYVAIGRMQRLGVRHLLVTEGKAMVGMASARGLLKLRAAAAPAIGDAISVAASAADVARQLAELPDLAATLIADDCTGHEIAAVISGVFRDATERAARHADAEMAARGHGPPPAPFAYLILGSGGRGESLLRPDQDNAIVHAGTDADDAWFAEFGHIASDFLDAAGIPYCQGHVMASEPQWRRTVDGWHAEIGRWIARTEEESLLNVDIFYDFQLAYGESALAASLRQAALEMAARSPRFLTLLANQLDALASPFGLFGRLRVDRSDGRLDAKMGGLLPVVGAARAMALAHGVPATATPARLHAVADAGLVDHDATGELIQAHGRILCAIVRQQIADCVAGNKPSNRVAPRPLSRTQRRGLVDALRTAQQARLLVRDALTAERSAGERP